jgi:hypothetical protein
VGSSGPAPAIWLLEGLGAGPLVAGRGDLNPVLLDDLAPGSHGSGLPAGLLEWAGSLAAAVAAVSGWLTGIDLGASAAAVAAWVRLPEVVSVGMRPSDPIPFGGDWLHADVSAGDDTETFETCLSTLPARTTAAEAAATAQQWRLAVCDYRAYRSEPPAHPLSVSGGDVAAGRGLRVLDLSAMWAGPMATALLQSIGVTVVKVEPEFRPDGFRSHPDLFDALNAGKQIVGLDLRRQTDRDELIRLAGESDVVFDTFSPRVMPNFGFDSQLSGATRVAMPAFGPGPERNWVAYGTGVHAVSGLGDVGDGTFAAGAVSYPDPLGGLTAALGISAALAGRHLGHPVGRVDTSLSAAVQPLLSRRPDRRLLTRPDQDQPRLELRRVFHRIQNLF